MSGNAKTAKNETTGYVVIAVLGCLVLAGVYWKSGKDYAEAVDNYRAASQREADLAARTVESALNQIYQNIRTISFLPSCLVPRCAGVRYDQLRRDELWDRYCMGAPERQRQCVERYNIVKRA